MANTKSSPQLTSVNVPLTRPMGWVQVVVLPDVVFWPVLPAPLLPAKNIEPEPPEPLMAVEWAVPHETLVHQVLLFITTKLVRAAVVSPLPN